MTTFSAVLREARGESAARSTALGRDLRLVRAVAPALGDVEVAGPFSRLTATYRSDAPSALTAVVLTRDEEERIGACLNALAGDCDDVLLVDARSTDGTLEVARRSSATVRHVTRDWTDDFAAQRNTAFAAADGTGWLAHVDADETLHPDSNGRLRRVLTALDHVLPHTDLVVSPHIIDTSQEEYTNTQRVLRVRSALRFRGRLHERPYDAHGNTPLWAEVDVTFRHTGYEPAVIEGRGKRDQYARLLRQCLAEEPDNPKWQFYAVRDGLVGITPDPRSSRELFERLRESLPLYERPDLPDYRTERRTDALVLLCELALGFGGGPEITEVAPLLEKHGRLLEATYYTCLAESSALLNRASGLLDRLATASLTPRPGSRRMTGRSHDLQGLLALTCGRYDELPALLAQARTHGAGELTTSALGELLAHLPDRTQ